MLSQHRKTKVTLTQVAKAVGVSVATVSNVYNGTGRVSAQLRQRIFEAGKELGFVGSDPLAKGLRRGHVNTVGWILTESLAYAVENESTLLFLRGMNEQLENAAVGLLIVSSPSERTPKTTIVKDAIVDGFIGYSLADDDPMLAAARARGSRIIIVEQPIIPDVPSVLVDNYGGSQLATRHLLELGHRNFGILTLRTTRISRPGPINSDSYQTVTYDMTRQRLRGYQTPLIEAGIDVKALPIYESANNPETARKGAHWLLAQHPRPTALLAMSDMLALGALHAARDYGLRIPEDLSLIGFDDAPSAALMTPPLTTVRQPLKDKGTQAARLLLGHLGTQGLILPTELVIRGSTGSVPRTPQLTI